MIENGQRISMSPHCPILGTPGDGWERGHNIVAVAVLHHTFHAPRVSQTSLKTLAKLIHSFQQIFLSIGGFGVKNLNHGWQNWMFHPPCGNCQSISLVYQPMGLEFSKPKRITCFTRPGQSIFIQKYFCSCPMLNALTRPIYFYLEIFSLLSHAQCFKMLNYLKCSML